MDSPTVWIATIFAAAMAAINVAWIAKLRAARASKTTSFSEVWKQMAAQKLDMFALTKSADKQDVANLQALDWDVEKVNEALEQVHAPGDVKQNTLNAPPQDNSSEFTRQLMSSQPAAPVSATGK